MVSSKVSHGILPASKEVVLEIQLRKLINDFFFASSEHQASNESEENSGSPVKSEDNVSPNNESEAMVMDASPFRQTSLRSPSDNNVQSSTNSLCSEMQNCTESKEVQRISGFSSPLFADEEANRKLDIADQSPNSFKSLMPVQSESNHMSSNCSPRKCTVDTTEAVKSADLNANVVNPKLESQRFSSTENVKAPRLTKTYSESGTLFYLSVETRRNAFDSPEGENSSIKLTRIGSMPNHQNHHAHSEHVIKHTCRKPPRPPTSPSPKDRYNLLRRYPSETILVLHSSRRAKLERRRRLAAASSSAASTWALVFTFFFAMVIIGEGFWNQRPEGVHSVRSGAADAFSSAMPTQLRVDSLISSRKLRLQSNLEDIKQLEKEISDLHQYNQFEEEMQVRALWIAKRLDMEPT